MRIVFLAALLLFAACDRTYIQGDNAFEVNNIVVDKKGRPLTGPYEAYYAKERPSFIGMVKNGRKHGTFTYYAPDGATTLEENYWDGKFHGVVINYKNGVKYSEYLYNQGLIAAPVKIFRPDGSQQFELTYSDGGELLNGACFHKNGIKRPLNDTEIWLLADNRPVECN